MNLVVAACCDEFRLSEVGPRHLPHARETMRRRAPHHPGTRIELDPLHLPERSGDSGPTATSTSRDATLSTRASTGESMMRTATRGNSQNQLQEQPARGYLRSNASGRKTPLRPSARSADQRTRALAICSRSAGTHLHGDHAARGKPRAPGNEGFAAQRAAAHRRTRRIDGVNLDHALGKIDAHAHDRAATGFIIDDGSCNLLHGLPFSLPSD